MGQGRVVASGSKSSGCVEAQKTFARITQTGKVPLRRLGTGIKCGIERVKSPLRLGDAPPLMRDQPVQHTAAGTSGKTLKSWHGAPPSSPGISV